MGHAPNPGDLICCSICMEPDSQLREERGKIPQKSSGAGEWRNGIYSPVLAERNLGLKGPSWTMESHRVSPGLAP